LDKQTYTFCVYMVGLLLVGLGVFYPELRTVKVYVTNVIGELTLIPLAVVQNVLFSENWDDGINNMTVVQESYGAVMVENNMLRLDGKHHYRKMKTGGHATSASWLDGGALKVTELYVKFRIKFGRLDGLDSNEIKSNIAPIYISEIYSDSHMWLTTLSIRHEDGFRFCLYSTTGRYTKDILTLPGITINPYSWNEVIYGTVLGTPGRIMLWVNGTQYINKNVPDNRVWNTSGGGMNKFRIGIRNILGDLNSYFSGTAFTPDGGV